MKDHTRRRLGDTRSGTSVHRPSTAEHYHYVKRPKWSSHAAQTAKFTNGHGARKYSWPFFGHEQPPLPSVQTECRPLVDSDTNDSVTPIHELESTLSFTERYGRCLEILHYGSNSTTRLHQSKFQENFSSKSPQLLAIKVYHYNILNLGKSLPKNATSTFCSPSSILNHHPDHPNILQITDLLYNERSELCLVMPFCEGGDLHELLSCHGPLISNEADCIIAQVLRALSFLHEHDTAHRDIRLETVLLTGHGAVKLAGFGNGHIRRLWNECAIPMPQSESSHHPLPSTRQPSSWSFSLPWLFAPFKSHEGEVFHNSGGFTNSTASFPGISLPYIPPEGLKYRLRGSKDEYDEEYENDPRPADIWSAAIVYLALIYGRLPWRCTRPRREDTRYLEYLRARLEEDGYPPIEALGKRRRKPIYAMLNPIPHKRITASAMLRSEWMDGVVICEAGEMGY